MSAWISTKDRLPDKEGKYLTASKVNDEVLYEVDRFGKIGSRCMAFFEYDINMNRRIIYVDAWMPIEPHEMTTG